MDLDIHNATNLEIGQPYHHKESEFWTREIEVRTKEGHTLTITLYTQDEDKEGIEITLQLVVLTILCAGSQCADQYEFTTQQKR